jgi:isopenicillin N synthase-like dioxygenase
MTQLPIIDLRAPEREIAQQIADACKAHGFFYIVGHDVDEALALRLERLSHQFFALPNLNKATKARYAMALGGPAWRGWFPLGGELTSGRPYWQKRGRKVCTWAPSCRTSIRG